MDSKQSDREFRNLPTLQQLQMRTQQTITCPWMCPKTLLQTCESWQQWPSAMHSLPLRTLRLCESLTMTTALAGPALDPFRQQCSAADMPTDSRSKSWPPSSAPRAATSWRCFPRCSARLGAAHHEPCCPLTRGDAGERALRSCHQDEADLARRPVQVCGTAPARRLCCPAPHA